MTVTEIECDHSCTWEAAVQMYNDAVQNKKVNAFFCVEKINGRPSTNVFLAVQVDGARSRLTYPHRVKWGVVATAALRNFALMYDMRQQAQQQAAAHLWVKGLQAVMQKGVHLEKFALLNGSVFSIWYNVRKAMDPNFDPDGESALVMRGEAEGVGAGNGRGRNGRNRGYNFVRARRSNPRRLSISALARVA